MRLLHCLVVFLSLSLVPSLAPAEVTRWEITKREPYAGGKSIGERGPCERLAGVVHFALSPRLAANSQIVDLVLAPTSADGKVEFWADFVPTAQTIARPISS